MAFRRGHWLEDGDSSSRRSSGWPADERMASRRGHWLEDGDSSSRRSTVDIQRATVDSSSRHESWEKEDVVVFLSNDGDSDPIYLWRESPVAPSAEVLSNDGDSEPVYLWRQRPFASAPLPAPADAGQTLAGNEDVDDEDVDEDEFFV